MPSRPSPRTSPAAVVDLVRQLGGILADLGLGEVEVSVGDLRVRVQRSPVPAESRPATSSPNAVPISAPAVAGPSGAVTVEAPMVGTFYRAPSPTSPPFVREGDAVKEGQTLAIIEAMKLMNEIESTVSGRVSSILVENGQAVEFGQPLILIEPAR